MKRMLCLWLSLLCLLPAAGISENENAPHMLTRPDGSPLHVQSQCRLGDELLVLAQDGMIYALDAKTHALREWLDTSLPSNYDGYMPADTSASDMVFSPAVSFSTLLSDGEKLWGIAYEENLYPIAPNQTPVIGKATLLEPVIFEDPQDEYTLAEQMLILNGILYTLYRPNSGNGHSTVFTAHRVADGKRVEPHAPKHLQAMTAYKDNLLLGLTLDYKTADRTGGSRQPDLVAFNPETGDTQVLGKLEQPYAAWESAVAFDGQNVLYTSDNKLFLRDAQGKETLCAYLPGGLAPFGGNVLMPAAEQRCAVRFFEGLMVYATQPGQALAQPMVFYDQYVLQEIHRQIIAGLGGTTATTLPRQWGDDTYLGQLLVSGSVDVMFLQSEQDDVDSFVDKGYLLDLSHSAVIREHLAQCYPMIQQQAMRGDGIFLVPYQMRTMALYAKPERLKELGMSVPETFADLCQYLHAWAQDASGKPGDIRPIAWDNMRKNLYISALQLSFAQQILQGEPLRFDTPLLRSMLAQADRYDLSALDVGEEDRSWFEMPSVISMMGTDAIDMNMMNSPHDRDEILLLKPEHGMDAAFPCQVGYLAVYAKTQHQDAAIRYIEAFLQSLQPRYFVMMYPDSNEPMQRPGVAETIAGWEQEINDLEKMLADAGVESREGIKSQLAQAREQLAFAQATQYVVPPEAIAPYRDRMQHAYIDTREINRLLWSKEFGTPLTRWQEGQISLDQYLQEADNKLRLMRLESQ